MNLVVKFAEFANDTINQDQNQNNILKLLRK